jgi:hypothetical protein
MAAGQHGGAQHLDLKVPLIGILGLSTSGHGSQRDGGQKGGGFGQLAHCLVLTAALFRPVRNCVW